MGFLAQAQCPIKPSRFINFFKKTNKQKRTKKGPKWNLNLTIYKKNWVKLKRIEYLPIIYEIPCYFLQDHRQGPIS